MNYYRPTTFWGAVATMGHSVRQIWREYRDVCHCRKKMRHLRAALIEDLKPKSQRRKPKPDTRGAFALVPLLLVVLALGFFFGELVDSASRAASRATGLLQQLKGGR